MKKRIGNGAFVAIVAVCLLACGSTVRAQITWDNGSGDWSWNLTSANWDGGGFYTDGDAVTFGGTAQGTVNVDAGLTPGSVTVSNGNYTLQGAGWGGSGGLTKSGSGTLILSGANTYSGITTISGGTLQVGEADNLGASTATYAISMGTATLRLINMVGTDFGKSISTPTVNINGTIYVGGTGTNQTHSLGTYFDNSNGGSLTINGDLGYSLYLQRVNYSGANGGYTFTNNLNPSAGGTVTIGSSISQRGIQHVGPGHTIITGLVHSTKVGASEGDLGLKVRHGGGTLTLLHDANTFTSDVYAYQGATLEFTSIKNVGGGNSALGAPTTVAQGTIYLGSGITSGTLRYIGTSAAGHSSDRVIQLRGTTGGATIDASGVGPLVFTSDFTAAGVGSKTLTLSGSNTGNNEIQGAIPNHDATRVTSLLKDGPGTWVLSGDNSYTGTTAVNAGTLLVNGVNSGGGLVTVAGGATLGGSGSIASTITGAGLVSPGNSPGILTVGQVDPSPGLNFAFEFTAPGSPDYTNAAASINDVLRITHATDPFTSALTGVNTVDLYLNVTTLGTDIFRGGFYTDRGSDFWGDISAADFNVWVLGDGNGNAASFGGNDYYSFNQFLPGAWFETSTVFEAANFSGGGAAGYVFQLSVVPEPEAFALGLLGALAVAVLVWRRRKHEMSLLARICG